VSAGWPQFLNANGPAFLLESALADVLPDDWSQWTGGTDLTVDVGPVAALEAAQVAADHSVSFDAELGGLVSVYARAVDGDPTLTLSVGDGSVTSVSKVVELSAPAFDSAAFDAGDGWVRIAVTSGLDDSRVTIAVAGGTAAVSAPQHDPTRSLTSPLIAGSPRVNSQFALFGGDIGAGINLGTFTLDATVLGDGAVASLFTAISGDDGAPIFQGMQTIATGETMTVQTVVANIDLSNNRVLTARPFENVGRVAPIVLAWRDLDVLVQTKAQLQHRGLVPPVTSPFMVLLGGYLEADAVGLEVHGLSAEDEARVEPLAP
jgi:hypothetical protein